MPSTPGIGRRNLRYLNLNHCFSNFTPESESPPMSPTATATSSHPCPTPSPSPSIMIKNFNSLYDPSNPTLTISPTTSTSISFEPEPEPADFATAFASQRFFFSSPGLSNSLIEYTNTHTHFTQPSSSSTTLTPPPEAVADGGQKKKKKLFFNGSVAVPTYSPDPYMDFRRSMQEMVEARPELLMDVKSNWNILHELLLCYLALNPKSTHKFILGAFADLLVSLMSFSSPPPPPHPISDDLSAGGGGC